MKDDQRGCTHPDHVAGVSCEDRAVSCRADCVCCEGAAGVAWRADKRAAICVAACAGFADPTALPQCIECLIQYQNGGGNVSTTFRARDALRQLLGDGVIRHARPSDLPPSGGDVRCES